MSTWPLHDNTPSSEFIQALRDWAIGNRVDERFIHRLDELRCVEDIQAEADKLGEELSECENDRDDLYDELEALVKAVDENLDPDKEPPEVTQALKAARDALERHSNAGRSK